MSFWFGAVQHCFGGNQHCQALILGSEIFWLSLLFIEFQILYSADFDLTIFWIRADQHWISLRRQLGTSPTLKEANDDRVRVSKKSKQPVSFSKKKSNEEQGEQNKRGQRTAMKMSCIRRFNYFKAWCFCRCRCDVNGLENTIGWQSRDHNRQSLPEVNKKSSTEERKLPYGTVAQNRNIKIEVKLLFEVLS